MPTTVAAELACALDRLSAVEARCGKIFTALYLEAAQLAAAYADRRWAGRRLRGPMDGRLVSIKDLFDVAGEPTVAGSSALADQPPASVDAPVVERLRRAGAVVLGKTHMTELAFSGVGLNWRDGNPGNPADQSRVPGGSSSGAAISVVGGIAEIAIGSDTGGSVRIPAALCGAVGFKPTSGRVPTRGAFSLSRTLDVVGPIASSVDDCALADAILAEEAYTPLAPVPLSSLRFTVARGRLFADADAAVVDAFDHVLDRLRAAGAVIAEGSLEAELDDLARLDAVGFFPAVDVADTLRELGVTSLDRIDPRVRARIEAGAKISADDYASMLRLREALVRRVAERQQGREIFLMPTVPILAPPIAEADTAAGFPRINGLLLRNTRVANLFDCPAISLPVPGTPLPVGFSLVGARGHDRALLAAARAVETVLRT